MNHRVVFFFTVFFVLNVASGIQGEECSVSKESGQI